MQEAKYCEDIVPAIKLSLESAGWINEHDRLGHFESKVPADTFFALASARHFPRFFGLQFKAPDTHLRWNLTHTEGQFDKIRLDWPKVIYYALPYYTALTDSNRGLELCAFVDSTVFPDVPSRIVRSELPLPEEYVARMICAYCCDYLSIGQTSKERDTEFNRILPRIYKTILKHGPDEFIAGCISAYGTNTPALLKKMSVSSDQARFVAVSFRDTAWRYIADWNGDPVKCKGTRLPRDKMNARVLLNARFNSIGKPLTFDGTVHVDELKLTIGGGPYLGWDGFAGMEPLSNLLKFSGAAPYQDWNEVLARIQDGSFGVELNSLDLDLFKGQFGHAFSGEEHALLVWYTHIERIFYAIEIKRLAARGSDGVLGFMDDSLIAALLPETRTRIARAARRLGLTPAALLERIVRVFLLERDGM